MLSRALSLATVMLFVSFAAVPVQAQNLEAGKSPSQIFSGTCMACHKSPRGLLKTVTPGALPGFLRQHYTTSSDMASSLSAYVVSNGATDTRAGGGLTRQGQDAVGPRKPADARPGAAPAAAPAPAESPSFFGFGRRAAEPAPEARPEPEAAPMTPRQKRAADRAAKRLGRPAAEATREAPAAEAPPAQKHKLGKKGRRVRDEAAKPDARDEPKSGTARPEATKPDVAKPEPAGETLKPETAKPAETKPEAARPDVPLRADPVPAVTPAPKASESEPKAESKPESEPKSE
jgi:hypothetical protein